MNILDIAIAKKLAGGGGGSGTDNYNDLSNLPKINDTTLSGNKSSSALGLQSEINSDSKLASDLVDDTNQDNKFVTSTEKNTWNAKQNAIDSDHKLSSDLVDDANHTNKFVTSTEKQTWNAKQNAIDADHKLSSSLVSFTDAEAAALASGIDSSKVGQISTNQTNILYGLQNGTKNYLTTTSGTYSGDNPVSRCVDLDVNIPAGEYIVFFGSLTSTDIDDTTCRVSFVNAQGNDMTGSEKQINRGTNVYVTTSFSDTAKKLRIYYANGWIHSEGDSITFSDAMVCSKVIWDTLGHTYQPPALPNSDLTYLEAEDRAALAEEIDAGAKNVLNCSVEALKAIFRNTEGTWSGNVYTVANVGSVTVNSDGSLKVVKTGTSAQLIFRVTDLEFSGTKYAGYILSGCPKNGSDSTYRLVAEQSQSPWGNIALDEGDGGVMKSSSIPIYVYLRVSASYTTSASGITFYPMICTKAAFGVSNKFVPYRGVIPSNIVMAKTIATTPTETIVPSLTITIPAYYRADIKACLNYSNGVPLTIRILDSDSIAPSTTLGLAQQESTNYKLSSLCTTALTSSGGADKKIYFSAQSANSSNNTMIVIVNLYPAN